MDVLVDGNKYRVYEYMSGTEDKILTINGISKILDEPYTSSKVSNNDWGYTLTVNDVYIEDSDNYVFEIEFGIDHMETVTVTVHRIPIGFVLIPKSSNQVHKSVPIYKCTTFSKGSSFMASTQYIPLTEFTQKVNFINKIFKIIKKLHEDAPF
jgi:hypothetical protein